MCNEIFDNDLAIAEAQEQKMIDNLKVEITKQTRDIFCEIANTVGEENLENLQNAANDYALNVATTVADMTRSAAKEIEKTGQVHLSKKVVAAAKIGGPVCAIAIDIMTSKEKEGVIKAVITAGVSYMATAATVKLIGISAGSIIMAGGIPAILTIAGIAALGYGISILADKGYDFLKPYIKKAFYDAKTKILELVTEAENIDEIKEFIRGIKGIKSVETVYVTSITENRTYKYKVVYGDTIWQMCKDNDITYEQLLEVNPWLKDRFSDDFSFALIRPDEEIIIPEKIKWEIDENLRDEWEEIQTKLRAKQRRREKLEKIVKALMDEIIKAANNRSNGGGYFKEGSV